MEIRISTYVRGKKKILGTSTSKLSRICNIYGYVRRHYCPCEVLSCLPLWSLCCIMFDGVPSNSIELTWNPYLACYIRYLIIQSYARSTNTPGSPKINERNSASRTIINSRYNVKVTYNDRFDTK